jgi:hypothetical protein
MRTLRMNQPCSARHGWAKAFGSFSAAVSFPTFGGGWESRPLLRFGLARLSFPLPEQKKPRYQRGASYSLLRVAVAACKHLTQGLQTAAATGSHSAPVARDAGSQYLPRGSLCMPTARKHPPGLTRRADMASQAMRPTHTKERRTLHQAPVVCKVHPAISSHSKRLP